MQCLADEPDAPGKPEILSYDRDRAELSWAEPASDGGDKITGYTIEKKEPKGHRQVTLLRPKHRKRSCTVDVICTT